MGLTGYAGCGKDTFADGLTGFHKMGFADPLYKMAIKVNPVIWTPWPKRLSTLVEKVGWTKAKKYPKARRLLQELGDLVRENLSSQAFIDAMRPRVLKKLAKGEDVVITNVRYPNEADFILELGGSILRIDRPGTTSCNEHSSDAGKAFEYASSTLQNAGTAEMLSQSADAAINEILGPKRNMHPIGAYHAAVSRGLAEGVKCVLRTAAPATTVTAEWLKRHSVELEQGMDEAIIVLVDGEEAGEVSFQDNVITIDVVVAR